MATRPAARARLVAISRVAGIGGVACYNWWIYVLWTGGMLSTPNEFFSDLEAGGGSHAPTLRHFDIAAGVILTLALLARGRYSRAGSRPEWRWLVVFALASAIGGVFSYSCAEGTDLACRGRPIPRARRATHHRQRRGMTAGGASPTGDFGRPVFDHLARLSDGRGLFEHALHAVPRREHGYCLDDVARGLVVVCREPAPGPVVRGLARSYLAFVLLAFDPSGACHNRMAVDGRWQDEPALGDWWGRAVWGLGVAAVSAETAAMRARALNGFRIAAQQRSPHRQSMAYAALGAAEIVRRRPQEVAARQLLQDAIVAIGEPSDDPQWPWPTARLSYGNATLAEALIVAGEVLPDQPTLEHGLRLLDFLLETETRDGHLSVTPVGGRGPGENTAGFDQQPIEVAALSDACASAYRITGDARWLAGVNLAWAWFLGDNDSAVPMFDAYTGGGYDGLERNGRNLNQGAESTLAMLSTAQHARRLSG